MMETKRNKEWRKKQCFRVFKNRMMVRTGWVHFEKDGRTIWHPHWFELMATHWAKVYKTTGTPCSCPLCHGERYDRRAYKKEIRRILNDSLN